MILKRVRVHSHGAKVNAKANVFYGQQQIRFPNPSLGDVVFQGGASWWTAEEENDRISMKKTNHFSVN